jgi:hypothetical protein
LLLFSSIVIKFISHTQSSLLILIANHKNFVSCHYDV